MDGPCAARTRARRCRPELAGCRRPAYLSTRISDIMLDQPRREPMLNVPAVVVALLAVLGLIHALLALVLTQEQTTELLLLFAFIPARYDASVMPDVVWPG